MSGRGVLCKPVNKIPCHAAGKAIPSWIKLEIERTWFGNLTNIQAQSSSSGSASLAFWSFRGLFLITGLVSILMLIIYLIIFFCKEWDKLKAATSERTVWKKVVAVSKHYDRRESTAHTSKIYQEDVVAGEREANQD